jgi:hypothetical protein
MLLIIKSFLRKIKRTIEFLPHIWRGYDFDYRYSIDLFQYQLTRTAKYLESENVYSMSAKQDARRLRTIIELMKKVYDEEYRLGYWDEMERIWGTSELDWGKENEDGTITYLGTKWEFANTLEKQKEAEWMYSGMSQNAEKKHLRAKKLLWELIEHNLEKFWD